MPQHDRVPLDWRTMQPTYPPTLIYYAGRRSKPSTPSPIVFVLACEACGQRWLGGSPIVLDPSPCCDATLLIVRLWDTRLTAYPWAESLIKKLYRQFAGQSAENQD